MRRQNTEQWLAEFQADFTAVLRTPLDRTTGHLKADTTRYPSPLLAQVKTTPIADACSGLAVYNRQYWFRLFAAMQGEFPLVARLMGYWQFNAVVESYLTIHPPVHVTLHLLGHKFTEFLALDDASAGASAGFVRGGLPSELLLEAAKLDAMWSQIFLAPDEPVWRPHTNTEDLLNLQLQPAQRWGLFEQNWPLVHLRHQVRNLESEKAIPAPAKLESTEWWLLRQLDNGVQQVQLTEMQATLYQLVSQHPLGEALAMFESATASVDVPTADVTAWLEASMSWELWTAADRR